MTVVEPADATRDHARPSPRSRTIPGPVYLRLKRGETPVIFEEDHRLDIGKAQVLRRRRRRRGLHRRRRHDDSRRAGRGPRRCDENGVSATVINSPTIKPLDAETILAAARNSRIVITAENHTVIGGLGSAVAEAMAEAGVRRALAPRRHRGPSLPNPAAASSCSAVTASAPRTLSTRLGTAWD